MPKDEELDSGLLRDKGKPKNQEQDIPPPAPYKPNKPKKHRFSSAPQQEEEADVAPLWLITFSDAIALMLTFFVLLYAMSTPEKEQFDRMTSSINKEFGEYFTPKWNAGANDTISIDRVNASEALSLKYLRALLMDMREKSDRLSDVTINLQKDRLIISLPSTLLFASGKADVQGKGKRTIFVLGDVLSRIRNKIEVVGHADPRPAKGEFSSNWQLSLARAASVAGVLQDIGYSRDITIRGLSDGRYSELPDDMDEEERLQLARRVDIVILRGDGQRHPILKLDGL